MAASVEIKVARICHILWVRGERLLRILLLLQAYESLTAGELRPGIAMSTGRSIRMYLADVTGHIGVPPDQICWLLRRPQTSRTCLYFRLGDGSGDLQRHSCLRWFEPNTCHNTCHHHTKRSLTCADMVRT
jgi:hypothetical protein